MKRLSKAQAFLATVLPVLLVWVLAITNEKVAEGTGAHQGTQIFLGVKDGNYRDRYWWNKR